MARMEAAYSSLFGSPPSKGRLYGGFYTFLGGCFMGVAAVVFLFVANQYSGQPIEFRWREASYALAAVAGMALFGGIALTLPSKRSMRTAAVVGVVLCTVALMLFLADYPLHFNVPNAQVDHTERDVGLYAVGLVLLLASAFTSLIGFYVDRITAAAGKAGAGSDVGNVEGGYDIPDSVIEADVESAFKRYKYAWGDEGATAATSGIQINIQDEFEQGTVVGGKGVARTVQLESPQVDEATQMLRSVRPKTERQVPSAWAEDATSALLKSRQQKAALVAAGTSNAPGRRLAWWQRLLQWLGVRRYATPSSANGDLPTHKVGK